MSTKLPDWPAIKVDGFFGADDPYAACRVLSAHNQMLHGQINSLIFLLFGLCAQEGGPLRITAETVKRMPQLPMIHYQEVNGDLVIRILEQDKKE